MRVGKVPMKGHKRQSHRRIVVLQLPNTQCGGLTHRVQTKERDSNVVLCGRWPCRCPCRRHCLHRTTTTPASASVPVTTGVGRRRIVVSGTPVGVGCVCLVRMWHGAKQTPYRRGSFATPPSTMQLVGKVLPLVPERKSDATSRGKAKQQQQR